MPSSLDTTQKINSLTNMQKVTRAMNLIASIRLHKLAARLEPLEAYGSALAALLALAAPALRGESHHLVAGYPEVRVVHLVVFTADRGLCGSHNHAVHRALDRVAYQVRSQGGALELTCIGTKGANYARRKGYAVFQQTETGDQVLTGAALRTLADKVFSRFVEGRVQAVHLVYNRFLSTLHQETQTSPALPLPLSSEVSGPKLSESQLDPAGEEFAPEAGRLLFQYQLAMALGHSAISEQAARMTAMESASKNAQDLTKVYAKVRNRARQSSITNELVEIISGKEAMKR